MHFAQQLLPCVYLQRTRGGAGAWLEGGRERGWRSMQLNVYGATAERRVYKLTGQNLR